MAHVKALKNDPHYGHWKYDLLKNEISYCPGFIKILNLKKRSAESLKDLLRLVPGEFLGSMIYTVKQAGLRGTDFNIQVPVNIGSQNKWIRLSGTTDYMGWGKPTNMLGVIEDVTQQVNEEKISMSILNHELRTPLTVIRLHSQMLVTQFSESLSPGSIRLSKNITSQTDNMISIMDEFTNISFNHQRKRTLNLSKFIINELIIQTVNDLKLIYPQIRFDYKSTQNFFVHADKFQLMQVLINYLTNAVKFSPNNGAIRIESYIAFEQLEVAVHDEGTGFKPGLEQKIFDKFYRLDNRNIRQQNSKGLGLFLVKDIIAQHGGRVRASAGMKGGASFYFTIPVLQE
jgi:two-component system sensor histidine kinase VicK